jgi:hypothetical protein
MRKIQMLDVERRIERLLRAAADEARPARIDLGHNHGPGERWARMMFAGLEDLDHLGGEVSRRRFLQIGEKHGYHRRGVAGFYQQLVEPRSEYKTRLTPAGRKRLQFCVSVMERADRHDRQTDTPAERRPTGSTTPWPRSEMPGLLRLFVGLRKSSPQHFGEHDGVVVLRVTRGVDEGKRALAGPPPELRQPGASAAKLLEVAVAKLLEATGVMREPLPELRARRQFRFPLIELGPLSRDPTWPEAVDQDSVAVRGGRRFVRTFQTYIHPDVTPFNQGPRVKT